MNNNIQNKVHYNKSTYRHVHTFFPPILVVILNKDISKMKVYLEYA